HSGAITASGPSLPFTDPTSSPGAALAQNATSRPVVRTTSERMPPLLMGTSALATSDHPGQSTTRAPNEPLNMSSRMFGIVVGSMTRWYGASYVTGPGS